MVPKDKPSRVLFVREERGIRFEWMGGQYIELFSRYKAHPKDTEQLWIDNATIRPPGWYSYDGDVINVWDNEKNKPSIPLTQKAFDRKVDEWLANNK